MKRVLSLLFCSIIFSQVFSQNVAINNDGSQPNAGAILDIKSANKGLLIPRVNLTSETDVSTIPSPVTSLLVFNTNAALPDGVGFYFWNGNNKWSKLATVNASNSISWGLAGNSGINPVTDFIGTTDNQPLVFKTNNILSGKIDQGINSVYFGQHAGESITTATDNTFIGDAAGSNNTSGSDNLFAGPLSGNANTSGYSNIFLGKEAGKSNISGFLNLATGIRALYSNTNGQRNIAHGYQTLYYNTTGSDNLGVGTSALYANTTGVYNIGIGYHALEKSVAAGYNIAIGSFSLLSNVAGDENVGVGNSALILNNTGHNNIAIGGLALSENTSGNYNVAIGDGAGAINGNLSNTACIGKGAGVRINNAMAFGNTSVEKWLFGIDAIFVNRALQIGSTAINGNGAFLTNGDTWTNASSRMKKENFSDLNSNDLLQKISQLSIQKWKYKGTDEYHIGPVAEDFYATFGLGTDDKGISTVDPAGIALAGMKELILINEKQNKLIEQLQERIEMLEKK
ncbi:MAG: tail fiber domain-containing protein [Ginsengibacter sp.]